MEGIGLSTLLIALTFCPFLFRFLALVLNLIHKKLEWTSEDIFGVFRGGQFIFVHIERSQNHVWEHVVLNFISLFDGNVLEFLLIVDVGQQIVAAITFNKLRLLIINFGCLSSVLSSQLLQRIIFHAANSKSELRVNFTCVPNLLVHSC